jgi:hypothetical protein
LVPVVLALLLLAVRGVSETTVILLGLAISMLLAVVAVEVFPEILSAQFLLFRV